MEIEELRKALKAMMADNIPLNSTWCKVKAVSAQTCTVVLNDLEIEDILLGFENSGVVVYPKVNSQVLVGFIDNTNTNGVVLVVAQTDYVEIMGTNYGGVPISDEIKDNLNAIKNYLATLNTAIGSGFTAVGAGTAANGANGKIAFDGAMASQTITYGNMENAKVKHGNG